MLLMGYVQCLKIVIKKKDDDRQENLYRHNSFNVICVFRVNDKKRFS